MSRYYENHSHRQDCSLRYITKEEAAARQYGCTCNPAPPTDDHHLLECANGSCRSIPVKQAGNVPRAITDRHHGHFLVDVTQFHHERWQYYCFNCGTHVEGDLLV